MALTSFELYKGSPQLRRFELGAAQIPLDFGQLLGEVRRLLFRARPPAVQARVRHDAHEPRAELRATLERPDRAIRLDERLLHRIERLVVVAQKAVRHPIRPGAIPLEQRPERLRVLPDGPVYQSLIGRIQRRLLPVRHAAPQS